MRIRGIVGNLAAILALCQPAYASAAIIRYSEQSLHQDDWTWSKVVAVNDRYALVQHDGPAGLGTARYDRLTGEMVLLNGGNGVALGRGINIHGDVAGSHRLGEDYPALLYPSADPFYLDLPPGISPIGSVTDIADNGDRSVDAIGADGRTRPVLSKSGQSSLSLSDQPGHANGLSRNGDWVAGSVQGKGARWETGQPNPYLVPLPGYSTLFGVDDTGLAVGEAWTPSGIHGLVFDGVSAIDLGAHPSGFSTYSSARAISSDVVIGVGAGQAGNIGLVWHLTGAKIDGPIDINDLLIGGHQLPPVRITELTDVADDGTIAAVRIDEFGRTVGVLLTPINVPEPSTCAMGLVGMVGMVGMALIAFYRRST